MSTASSRFNGIQFPDGTNAPSGVFNLKDPVYGVIPDGVTDNTVGIQAAYTAAAVKGGTVYWPSSNGERYTLTSMITVSSNYHVDSVGDMHGFFDNATTGAFIRPGANFGSNPMIRYSAPGLIRGLSFYDNTNGNHTPNYTMLCALDLFAFNFGQVEKCRFHVLNGGAFRAVTWVMGDMDRVVVRYCGTPSQPAISLEPTSLGGVQSTSLSRLKVESNYGTYLKINSNCDEVKLSIIGFESLSATDPTTCNTFVDNSGQRTFASKIHLNRNTATQWINQAASNFTIASDIMVNGDSTQTSNPAMTINGANHQFGRIGVRGLTALTTYALNVPAAFSNIDGVSIVNSGGISLNGNAYTQLANVYMASLTSGAGTSAIDVTSTNCQVSNVIMRALPANMNGIRVSGACGPTSVINAQVLGQNGTGAAFVDNNSSNKTRWVGNSGSGNTADWSATATKSYCIDNDWTGPSGIGQGTVTQATSITTGVTLNTPSGVVTTVSATTAAGSTSTFTVTDSTVVAGSVVNATLGAYSGTFGTNGAPMVSVSAVAAGSFNVTIYNAHASAALAGTLKINFSVL